MKTYLRLTPALILLGICGVSGSTFAMPIPAVNFSEMYDGADLVCLGRFTEIDGRNEGDLRSQARPLVRSDSYSAVFSSEVVFKGEASPAVLSLQLRSEEARASFGPSQSDTAFILFLKIDGDHYRLVQDTYYCALAVYTGGILPEVILPPARSDDPETLKVRLTAGKSMLWHYLKDSYDAYHVSNRDLRMSEFENVLWEEFLWQAIVGIGSTAQLKSELDQYLKALSSSRDAALKVRALKVRGCERDPSPFVEGLEAYKRKEISLQDLQHLSGILHMFTDPSQSFSDVRALAEALAIGDPAITRDAAGALRWSNTDEAVPLLVDLLDNENAYVRYDAVMGLWNHEQEDKEFALTQDYQAGLADFESNPSLYVNRWKAWWSQHGKEKYAFLQEQAAGK